MNNIYLKQLLLLWMLMNIFEIHECIEVARQDIGLSKCATLLICYCLLIFAITYLFFNWYIYGNFWKFKSSQKHLKFLPSEWRFLVTLYNPVLQRLQQVYLNVQKHTKKEKCISRKAPKDKIQHRPKCIVSKTCIFNCGYTFRYLH